MASSNEPAGHSIVKWSHFFNDLIIQLATQLWYDHILSDVITSYLMWSYRPTWQLSPEEDQDQEDQEEFALLDVLGASRRT